MMADRVLDITAFFTKQLHPYCQIHNYVTSGLNRTRDDGASL